MFAAETGVCENVLTQQGVFVGNYNVGQICLSGHAITGSANTSPQFRRTHCDKCGAKTIMECPSCHKPIQGSYESSTVVMIGFAYEAPAYCCHCGAPFPWTEESIRSAVELLAEELQLGKEEVTQLEQSVRDVTSDTPRTPLGTARLKRSLAKAGKETAGAVRDVLVDVVSESVKKAIWG